MATAPAKVLNKQFFYFNKTRKIDEKTNVNYWSSDISLFIFGQANV